YLFPPLPSPRPSSPYRSLFPSDPGLFFTTPPLPHRPPRSFPTRRSSDLITADLVPLLRCRNVRRAERVDAQADRGAVGLRDRPRSEEHTSELQALTNVVCPLLLETTNSLDRKSTRLNSSH